MNTAKAFVAIAMMGLVVASCSSDSASDSNPSLVNDQIQFATSTQPIIHTRAVNNADNLQDKKFLANEPINVYLTDHETKAQLLPRKISDVADDYYKFTVGDAYTGAGATENSQVLVAPNGYMFQFPGTDAGVDVYAIHPASTVTNVTKNTTTFSVKEDQTVDVDYVNSDLITATAGNKKKADGTIMLNFAHKLSKVIVKLQVASSNNSSIDLTDAKISINGNKTVALTHTFADATGETTLTLGETSDTKKITLGKYDEQNGTAGIIIPQTANAGTKLIQVELANGNTFSYTPADNETFEPEKEYTYTLTLKAELLTLVSVEIKDWTKEAREGDAILD